MSWIAWRRRQPFGWWLILSGLFSLGTAHAAWDFTAPGDPNRGWGASVSAQAGFDDNVFTTASNKQASATANLQATLGVNLPREQTGVKLRYTYGVALYDNRTAAGGLDQSHSADLLVTHSFSPRLALSLSDTFRAGIEPELVEQLAGVPIVTRRRGDYIYNSANGGVSYELTRRWSLSANEAWERWRYADAAVADVNDRDSYATTVSAVYALDPRSSLGGNYQFSFNQYVNAGTNSTRNSDSHSVYLSYVRRFNPQLSIQVNPGFELQEFGDGTQSTAPTVGTSATYAFGAQSLATAGFSYYLSATEVASFRSSELAVMYLSLQHRFATKLRAGLDFSYVISTFQNPNPSAGVLPSGLREDSWRLALSCTYDFTNWARLSASYQYSSVFSDIPGRSFDRNQVGLGMVLSY